MAADLPTSTSFKLELEPMEGEAGTAPVGRAVFNPNTRSAPRRTQGERRTNARVQTTRRVTDDRRAKSGWEKATP